MFPPKVTEISRAGSARKRFPRTQRELVALSLAVGPAPRTVKPVIESEPPYGIAR